MNPHLSDGSDPRSYDRLEQRLREGARAFAPAPPPELRARILGALHAAPPPIARPRLVRAERRGSWLAAAAALLALLSAWWLTPEAPESASRSGRVVALSRDLLDAGTRVLALPGQAEGNLRSEAEKLLEDTSRVAAGVVRGLPAPLRAKLERASPQRM